MRIKKLELVGFKSFKDRTVIHFDAGITGIVGPNGCGKSNIVDALVWVMGEMSAKHLRGSSMEDVIFAGADGYAPAGMAEVSLTLENDGGPFPAKYLSHSEIMVTRRLTRGGESQYLINKEDARLRDIQEIFMDTGAGSKGFSIIEQGAIGKIITAKPEDRRSLIEEAAGITKFKVRKRESQRKLQATDQNLVRLQDIIGELKRQLGSLQRQAQRAERYRKLKTDLEDLDLWVSSRRYGVLKAEGDQAEAEFNEAQAREVSGESDLSQLQATLEQQKLQLAEFEAGLDEKQQAQQDLEKTVVQNERAVQELRFEIEQGRRNREMTGNIVQEQEARKTILEKDLEQLESRHRDISQEVTQIEEAFAEKNEIYQGILLRIQDVDQELTDKRRELFAVTQSESQIAAQKQALQGQLEELRERLQVASAVFGELEQKRQEFEKRRNKLFAEVEQERQMQLDLMKDAALFAENKSVLEKQVGQKEQEVNEFKDELNQVTSRLYGLEDLQANFEGFQEGVKHVMFWQKQRQEAHPGGGESAFRPMAEVIEVPPDYEIAMEAALGNRLQMLLAEHSAEAIAAVDYLKDSRQGRSSFYSVDIQDADVVRPELPTGAGVCGVLKDQVRVPEKYQASVAHLLDGIVVVDKLRTALQLRSQHPGWTFVTLEGDTLSADGVITGGASEGAESGVLKRRREIKELSQKKEELAGKLSLASLSLDKLQQKLAQISQDLENARTASNTKEVHLTGLKKDFERAENELKNALEARERQNREKQQLENQWADKEARVTDLGVRLDEIAERRQGLDESVEVLGEELSHSRLGVEGLQEEVTTLKVRMAEKRQEAGGLQRQLDMVRQSLNEVLTQLSKMSEETSRTTETLSANQILLEEKKVQLESLIHTVEEAKSEIARLRDEYEQLASAVRGQEKQVGEIMTAKNDLMARMNRAQLKLEQARMKEQYLVEQIRERYALHLPEVLDRYQDRQGDLEQAESEIADLRDKIGRIGEVNLSAIAEYDELETRYNFLHQQHEDLINAKEQLRKVIERINRICSRRFKETFEAVNERFTKVFPVLFGGGEARLILVEDEEKGEMGIDIVAKPPGKKMTSVSLMSGGEKALTAVSLIFAIFLVKPSPYCLLDEVDAPLDDANVFRYNDLVREMAKRSQIITVTHNKYTMEVAERLFGVTMEEKGVSKMVSVNLADAQRAVES